MKSVGSAICTLFEGDYHYGVGALINSLDASGYHGTLWAGYRGPLPPWADQARDTGNCRELPVSEAFRVRFVPVATDVHFTNHKPQFMLDLWATVCPESDALFYFDPDITTKCPWAFYEEWVRCGVALCEDLNSPLNPTHPLRLRWKSFFAPLGVKLNSSHSVFVNGGFVGVAREHRSFLEEWQRILDLVKPHADELRRLHLGDRTLLFQIPDQDALNVTLCSTGVPVSVLGREGMDFIPGGYTMSHAAGGVKPWRKRMLWSALQGIPPTMADKGYWQHVEKPIRLYPPGEVRARRRDLRMGAAVGRMLRRS